MEKFKMNGKLSVLLMSIALLFSACNGSAQKSTSSEGAEIQNVGVEAFKEAESNEEVILLDVRTPGETNQGIIEGAITMDFYSSDFDQQLSSLDSTKEVYVYCRSGGRSAKAADKLKDLGFKKVYNLKGGMNGWKSAGEKTVQP